MSVLLWWVPALLLIAVAWWRLRAFSRPVRERDLRRMRRALRGDR